MIDDPLAAIERDGGPVELVVFDADGTLRRITVPGRVCPYGPGEWEPMPNVAATCARIDWSRRRVATASNQDHVGYGHVTARVAHRLLVDALRAALGAARPPMLIRFCPHTIEARCGCRKPQPGMLLDAMARFRVPPERTLLVGDAPCDGEAAAAAGVRFAEAADFFGWRRSDLSK